MPLLFLASAGMTWSTSQCSTILSLASATRRPGGRGAHAAAAARGPPVALDPVLEADRELCHPGVDAERRDGLPVLTRLAEKPESPAFRASDPRAAGSAIAPPNPEMP